MFGRFKKVKTETVEIKEQEEKQPIKLSKSQIKQKEQYIQGLMAHNKLPIIILDKQWYDVKPIVKNEKIEKQEEVLLNLVKEKGALTNQVKQDSVIKQNLMQEVLKASELLNQYGDESKLAELEKLQKGIVKIGDELKVTEERLADLDQVIGDANTELIKEAVAISYEYMEVYKTQSSQLGDEIDKLRQEVVRKTAEKKKYDDETTVLYNYLHNMIGYKNIDKVDQVLGEK